MMFFIVMAISLNCAETFENSTTNHEPGRYDA
jgi:hypothetical protein